MHHILEKNKRLKSAKKSVAKEEAFKRPPSGINRIKKLQNHAQLASNSQETSLVLQQIQRMEQDLKTRASNFGAEAPQTQEALYQMVRHSNEQALALIKKGEFKVATQILHLCEYLLSSQIGQNNNALPLKYQTFNNLAHCHNVQANVRLSLKYLLKATEFAHQINGVDRGTILKNQPPICLVESYLNIANAYAFLTQYDEGAAYCERAVMLTQSLINDIIYILEQPEIIQEDKDFYGEQYHSQMNLHAMSFLTKGQIYEKVKYFEEAIQEYQQGKQVIEANYGTKHKSYMDFVNAINGAKLRIKYFMHSNLPQGASESYQAKEEPLKQRKMSAQESANTTTNQSNLFILEQERLKPVSQQKRLRPASAKQNSNSNMDLKPAMSHQVLLNNSNFQMKRKPSPKASLLVFKNRSLKRIKSPHGTSFSSKETGHLSNRSTSSSNADIYFQRNQQKKLQEKLRVYQTNPHQRSSSHNKECGDCHSQMEEIRKLQVEQQKLMNIIMQQQIGQGQNQMQRIQPLNPQQQPFQNAFQTSISSASNQSSPDNNFQQPPQQMYPQPPMYMYPYPPPAQMFMYPNPYQAQMMQPQFMMPQPYMQNGFQSGIFLPQQRYAGGVPQHLMEPKLNNFMNSSGAGNISSHSIYKSPDQAVPQQPQFGFDHQRAFQGQQNQPGYININDHRNQAVNNLYPRINEHQQHSASDINERDSHFGEEFDYELRTSAKTKDNFRIAQPTMHQLHTEQDWTKMHKVASPKQKLEERKQELNKLKQAAIKIQTFYRKKRAQQMLRDLLNQRRQKTQFHKQIYAYRNKGKITKVFLKASLISVIKVLKGSKRTFLPNNIEIQLYDQTQKKVIFESSLMINSLGFYKGESTTSEIIMNTMKVIFSKLKLTGDPNVDFIKQLEADIKKLGGGKLEQKVLFADPTVFSEGLKDVKNTKVTVPQKKVQTPQKQPELVEHSPQIDESIKDEYSFRSEPVSDDSSIKKKKRASSSSSEEFENENLGEKGSMVINEQVQFHQHEETKPQQQLTLKAQNTLTQQDFQYQANGFGPQVKVREAGYDFTKEQFKNFQSIHEQKTLALIKKKTSKYQEESDQYREDSFKEEDVEDEVVSEDQEKSPIKLKKKKSKTWFDKMNDAATHIQKTVRGVFARRETKFKKKTKLAQFVDNQSNDRMSLVTLTEKFSKKRKIMKYKLIVRNQNKKAKDKSHLLKLEKLPVEKELILNYLQMCIEIKWKGQVIESVIINSKKLDKSKLTNGSVKLNEVKPNQPQNLMEISLLSSDIKSQLPSTQNNVQAVQKFFGSGKNQIDQNESKNRAITKAQAYIRGYLVRKQYAHKLQKEGLVTLMRMAKRLSDGQLYSINLMSRFKDQIASSADGFYYITVRDVTSINDVYDLEISLDMAKQIFGTKTMSTAQLQERIHYETNKAEFIKMLESLDIIDGDFSLDFKKFRAKQAAQNGLLIQSSEITDERFARKKTQKEEVKRALITDSSPGKSSIDEDIIEEADSKYEVSPQQQVSVKKPQNPQKKLIQPSPIQNQGKDQPLRKKGQKVQSKRLRALVKIQSLVKGYLARNKVESLFNFRTKSSDPIKHLVIFKQGIFKVCGLFLMYILYTDQRKQHIDFTIREAYKKITIINMKRIDLAEFSDQGAEIDDIPDYIIDNIKEQAPEVVLDQKSGKLRPDWIKHLHEFIETNI